MRYDIDFKDYSAQSPGMVDRKCGWPFDEAHDGSKGLQQLALGIEP